jgi:hypothetical protein
MMVGAVVVINGVGRVAVDARGWGGRLGGRTGSEGNTSQASTPMMCMFVPPA